MIESWHVVGQKVVCIDDENHGRYHVGPRSFRKALPISKNNIYTIAKITTALGPVSFRLQEIGKLKNSVGGESFFDARRFRPVRPTSIECFRSLLSPTPSQVRELEDA